MIRAPFCHFERSEAQSRNLSLLLRRIVRDVSTSLDMTGAFEFVTHFPHTTGTKETEVATNTLCSVVPSVSFVRSLQLRQFRLHFVEIR